MAGDLDQLDLAVLRLLVAQPRAGVREYARQLGVARGTVQARLDRLQRTGVLTSFRPHIAPAAMGFAGLAYIHLNLAQGMLDETSSAAGGDPGSARGQRDHRRDRHAVPGCRARQRRPGTRGADDHRGPRRHPLPDRGRPEQANRAQDHPPAGKALQRDRLKIKTTTPMCPNGPLAPPPRSTPPGTVPTPCPGSGRALTPRELEVLRLIAAGLSNQEIALKQPWYGVVRQGMLWIWHLLKTVRRTSASVSSSQTQVR